ncbi:unnamed protein product [Calicophoron daubneyi]|uniref:Nuclear pore complex protein Nup153 n=1 Tax=Calicophoron daubneyi TaxID=300641 RepID=A0AAV2TIZ7_CALDB
MGDAFGGRELPSQFKRRKSFFRRIADSISTFVPSTLFGPNWTSVNANDKHTQHNAERLPHEDDSVSRGTQASQHSPPSYLRTDTQTFTFLNGCLQTKVDLDAADNSDGELSAHSSTSGVSSLLPKDVILKSRMGGHYPVCDPDGHISTPGRSASGSCSDAPDSAVSTSTYRPPSVTPWILSQNLKSADSSECVHPGKRQRLSVDCNESSSGGERTSLFYRARTTYGGAASCRRPAWRHDLEPTVPLRFELERTRGSLSEHSYSGSSNLSSTARRILENLERFSSPLSSVDHVPVPTMPSNLKFTPSSAAKSFRSHRFPPYMHAYNRIRAQRNRNLPVTSTTVRDGESSVLEASSSLPVSKSLTTSVGFSEPNKKIEFQHLPLFGSSGSTRNELTSKTVSLASSSDAFEFAPPIHRPASAAKHLVELSCPKSNPGFTFSTPNHLDGLSIKHALTDSVTLPRTYSSPIFNLITRSSESDSFNSPAPKKSQEINSSKVPANSWRCETCLMENPESQTMCTSCSLPKLRRPPIHNATTAVESSPAKQPCPTSVVPSEAETHVTSEKNSVPSKMVAETPTIQAQTPSTKETLATKCVEKWECPTCMVFNAPEDLRCPCCQTLKPVKESMAVSAVPVENNWECPTCMVSNSADKLSCPCCDTPRPGSKSSKPSESSSTSVTPVLPAQPSLVKPNLFPAVKFGLQPVCSEASHEPRPPVTFSFGMKSASPMNSQTATSVYSNTRTTLRDGKSIDSYIGRVFTVPTSSASSTSMFPNLSAPLTSGTVMTASSSPFFFPSTTSCVVTPASIPNFTNPSAGTTDSSTPSFTHDLPSKRSLHTGQNSEQLPVVPPKFQFGAATVGTEPKLPYFSANGLINGGSPGLVSVSSEAASTGFKFNLGPAPSFVAKPDSTPQSAPFSFGASNPPSCTSSGVFPSLNTSKPLFGGLMGTTPTSFLERPTPQIPFGTSAANPQTPVFGLSTNPTGVFCFGSSNTVSPSTFTSSSPVLTQEALFNSNIPSDGNVFSANSNTFGPRKKAHATRRLHR